MKETIILLAGVFVLATVAAVTTPSEKQAPDPYVKCDMNMLWNPANANKVP